MWCQIIYNSVTYCLTKVYKFCLLLEGIEAENMNHKLALILILLITLSLISTTEGYIVLQRQSQDSTNYCAEASLSMVLSYWGTNVTQIQISNYIRDVLGYPDPTIYGTQPSAMVLYAQSQGYNSTVIMNNTIENMQPYIAEGVPLIVGQWGDLSHKTGHARVVVGLDYGLVSSLYNNSNQNVLTNYVCTYDSAVGYWGGVNDIEPPYNISYSEFADLWTWDNNWTLVIQPYPIITPSPTPSPMPSPSPTPSPTATPKPTVTPSPTPTATPKPTANPTATPTATPTVTPTPTPTAQPTIKPSVTPSVTPTVTPQPTIAPTATPTSTPNPTIEPTVNPTTTPTLTPTTSPNSTELPSVIPTQTPTPTIEPTVKPQPIAQIIEMPTATPTETPIPAQIKSIPEFPIWAIIIFLGVSLILFGFFYPKVKSRWCLKR